MGMLSMQLCQLSHSQNLDTSTVAKALAVQKASLKTLSFEVEFSDDRWIATKSNWEETGAKTKASVVLDGKPGSRFRIDFRPASIAWVGNAAQFYEETRTFSFDGKKGIDWMISGGPKGATQSVNRATITADLPAAFRRPRSATGEEAMIHYLMLHGSQTLTALLSHPIPKPIISVSTKASSCNERECIDVVVEFKPKSDTTYTEVVSLDPTKSFAMLRREWTGRFSHGPFRERRKVWEVSDLEEIERGFFAPTKFIVTGFEDGAPTHRSRFVLRKFVFDDRGDDRYTVVLAPGCRVSDRRFGVSFIVGKDPDAASGEIKEQLKSLGR